MKSYVPFKPIVLVQKALAATVLIASVSLPISAQTPSIVVASTTSTEQSGLFPYLLPAFKKASGQSPGQFRRASLGNG